jgi:osmotically-inducible protein OsmY
VVSNGVVRLSGTAQSQDQRLSALYAARAVDGVKSVVDDVRTERKTAEQSTPAVQ